MIGTARAGVRSMEWLNQKLDTLDYHLARPEIDTSEYIQKRRLHFGRRVAGFHRLYLDTKQWLQMRDVAIGRPRNRIHSETYERLLSLRSNKKILCPISYSVFVELMNQSDEHTRLATARVIDKLAEGYCCVPPHDLAEREAAYFMAETSAKGAGLKFNQPPILHTVWTKVSFVQTASQFP